MLMPKEEDGGDHIQDDGEKKTESAWRNSKEKSTQQDRRTGHKKNRGDHELMETEIHQRMVTQYSKQRGRGLF